jgi:protein-S-isoprenylcysteine O-methyltransferase Ste14
MHFSMPSMRRPRHPLARFLSLLLGLAVIGVLLVFGLVVAGVLLVGGGVLLAVRQWKHARSPAHSATSASAHQPAVLEGEFVVVRHNHPVTH